MRRFQVIDALRGVLAFWVTVGHANVLPRLASVGQNHGTLDFIARGLRSIVWGPPAVMAFLVISGFCIHYPFAHTGRRCQVLRFYGRRCVRIGIPAAFTVAMFKLMFPDIVIVGNDSILWHSPLWSVLCEEIFYALYPILNRASRSIGLGRIVLVTFVVAMAVTSLAPATEEWVDLGILGSATVLWPVWLLGCYLADRVSALNNTPSASSVCAWRCGAWMVMWVAELLHFHGGVSQTRTCLWVGAFSYFWIRAEIRHSAAQPAWPTLVWAGRWSYSLYLIHPLIVALCVEHAFLTQGPRLNAVWMLGPILIAAYLFYLTVERPSHRWARKIGLLSPAGSVSREISARSPGQPGLTAMLHDA